MRDEAEMTFHEELLKHAFKPTGGPRGSGTPSSKVQPLAPNKLTEQPQSPTGTGAGQNIDSAPMDTPSVARSLGSNNRVVKRVPAPASLGKLAYSDAERAEITRKRISELATRLGPKALAAAGGVIVARAIRHGMRTKSLPRRLPVALGLGAGAAGLILAGHAGVKKYGPKKEPKKIDG